MQMHELQFLRPVLSGIETDLIIFVLFDSLVCIKLKEMPEFLDLAIFIPTMTDMQTIT